MPNHNEIIHTLEQALQIINYSEYANGNKLNISLWFRGQSSIEYELEPSIFRIKNILIDESEILKHSKFRNPNKHFEINNEFQWLCLMQHYDLPTRMLDWSESILVALYFAVSSKNNKKKDAVLYVLDTKKLNEQNTFGAYSGSTATPDDLNTIARMAFIHASTKKQWKELIEKIVKIDTKRYKEETGLEFSIYDFITPIAVYPYRTESRMIFQSSTFTLHGGKKNTKDIPEPLSLEQLNNLRCEEKKFLKKYIIPFESKEYIRKQLALIGIHEGSLFAELDKQASYLKDYFTRR